MKMYARKMFLFLIIVFFGPRNIKQIKKYFLSINEDKQSKLKLEHPQSKHEISE